MADIYIPILAYHRVVDGVASPLAGGLQSLHVKRGARVQAGALLFELDNQPELAARDEAERKLAQARANL